MEPVGLVIGTIISAVITNSSTTQLIEAVVSAVASGTFIYVAVIGNALPQNILLICRYFGRRIFASE
jgi:zinc transporter ZupT